MYLIFSGNALLLPNGSSLRATRVNVKIGKINASRIRTRSTRIRTLIHLLCNTSAWSIKKCVYSAATIILMYIYLSTKLQLDNMQIRLYVKK